MVDPRGRLEPRGISLPPFDLYRRLGIDAVKTGYVAHAGQAKVIGSDGKLHYAWHEGQDMARHHLKVVTEATERHISVNPHEPIKDTGLRRTYPNWITREGARGMEFSAWGEPGNPPEHEANLAFTRLLAGPMDYTPGIFGMKTRAPDGVATTWAKQLALYVVIYSPLQMAADLLDHYEANPKPFKFIEDVPVDWEDSACSMARSAISSPSRARTGTAKTDIWARFPTRKAANSRRRSRSSIRAAATTR